MSNSERVEKALEDVETEVSRLREFASIVNEVKDLRDELANQKNALISAEQKLADTIGTVEKSLEALSDEKAALAKVGSEIKEQLEGLLGEVKEIVANANVEHQKLLSEEVAKLLSEQKREITDAHRGEVAHVTDKLTVALEKVSLSLSAEINNKFTAVGKKTRLLFIIQMITAAILCGGFFYVLEKLTS